MGRRLVMYLHVWHRHLLTRLLGEGLVVAVCQMRRLRRDLLLLMHMLNLRLTKVLA